MGFMRVALVAAGTVGLVGAATCFVEPSYAARPIKQTAQSRLVLTVAHGEKASPVQRRVVLTCSPTGGTHKQAKAACAALTTAKGNPAAIKNDGSMCMMIYDPVTVTATGRWKARTVRFTHTYGNACVLHAATGAVFAF